MRTEIKAALVLGLFGILGAVIWGINSGRTSRVELPLDVSSADLPTSGGTKLASGFENFGAADFKSPITSPPLTTPPASELRGAADPRDEAADNPIEPDSGQSSDSNLPPRVETDQPLPANNETADLDDSDSATGLADRDEITSDPPVETPATLDQPLEPDPGGSSRLSELNTSPGTDKTYIIQPGDTFISIARGKYGHDKYWKAIQAANPDLEATLLQEDHVIKLPSTEQIAVLDRKSSAPADEARPSELAAIKQERGMYIVEPGDTLTAIARKLLEDGSRWDEIYELNRDKLSSPDRIVDGIELRIPKRAPKKTG